MLGTNHVRRGPKSLISSFTATLENRYYYASPFFLAAPTGGTGYGLNPHHSSNNAGSLTCYAMRELLLCLFLCEETGSKRQHSRAGHGEGVEENSRDQSLSHSRDPLPQGEVSASGGGPFLFPFLTILTLSSFRTWLRSQLCQKPSWSHQPGSGTQGLCSPGP